MKTLIILTAFAVAISTIIRIDQNEKGKMVAHPFARVQMLVQSVLYKIYA